MGEFLDFPTLIVIVVAIVVLLRLRSVLGTRTGNERPPSARHESISRTKSDNDDTVVPMPRRNPQDTEEAERQQRIADKEEKAPVSIAKVAIVVYGFDEAVRYSRASKP